MPRIGDRVEVAFLAATVAGTIESVDDDLHRFRVVTDEGELITFALNPALGRFIAEGQHTGARVRFGS